jgi:predicted acetyltransferase
MSVEIRPYAAADLRPFVTAAGIPFAWVPGDEDVRDHERLLERDRLLCAYDGDAIVGTAAVHSFRLTIPGGELPTAGVTDVGVLPSHRRRGILSAMMARLLDDIHARSEPLAVLWASEAAIYPRFGYGLATLNASFDLPAAGRLLRPAADPGGQTRLIERAEATRLLPPIYDAARVARSGFVTRTGTWWEVQVLRDREANREGAGPTFTVLEEGRAGPEGYLRYRMRHAWGPQGPDNVLEVRELIAATPRAEQALWRLVLGIDLVAHVRAWHQPVDLSLLVQLAEPRRLALTIGDGLFVRLVDLVAALSARGYAAAGSVVLQVADTGAPWNSGRWRLTVESPTRAPDPLTGAFGPAAERTVAGPLPGRVERTADPADLELDVTDLASCYLGAFTFGQLVRAGRAVELTPGAARRADALFAVDRAPWCPEVF